MSGTAGLLLFLGLLHLDIDHFGLLRRGPLRGGYGVHLVWGNRLRRLLLPLLAVAGIAIAVYTVYPSLSRTDIYNLTISLIVILFSSVAVASVLSLKKDPRRR